MKVGLYTISLSGGYYAGPAVPLLEVFSKAREWGYEGIEIEGKRPHGSPLDLDDRRRREIVHVARQEGLDIPAIAAYNDFSSPIEEHRQNELLMVRDLIRLAADVGAPIVRVFAAWSGVTRRDGLITYDVARYNIDHRFPGTTQLERWHYVRDCLAEAAEMAGRHGVTLALQNHEPICHGHEEVLEFIEEVGSPHLKASLDFPIMKDKSEEGVRRAVRETGDLMVHSHFGGEYDEGADGIPMLRGRSRSDRSDRSDRPDRPVGYETFIRAIKEQGYQGYLCYELCHPCIIGHRHFGLDEALRQVSRAAVSMRHLIQTV